MSTLSGASLTPPPLSGRTVLMLASGAGFSVASIYYSQPMLAILSGDLHASVTASGLVPTLTQMGYALGILLLAPLGDRHDRRTIITIKGVLLTLALLLSAAAGNIMVLLAASLAIGITATMAQDIVPASASLSPEAQRGKTVGTVMTGLLLGILLSRVVSGLVAQVFGWRVMFILAAALVLMMTLILWRRLPHIAPSTSLSYPALLASMRHLWRQHGELRRAALAQGLLSVGFSAFWSTLAVMLHNHYGLGSATAGAFGLAGAAGALAAPLAGAMADRRGPALVTQFSTALATVSFAALFLLPLLPVPAQLALIVISAIGFDFGVQATLVSHQTLIFGLEPAARSRLNALMFTGVFIGMAIGSALGSLMLEKAGWPGVVALLTLAGAGSFIVRMQGRAARCPTAPSAPR
ncbi:MFS transporter [Erwinia aphidicola]|jgi:predicted MFS family arabinose efflux permease|uniref:MFS transporter n=1 Tax=Erwinia aphidicola TaxID=68334 RepID=A0ABU8DH81_ERWAP|nr:MFS transporter [Erwinia aphidicola]KMV68699.1 MFS transporter [bacteria symbiont BFo1 of Frankliniella occidentalis]PIJ57188.1 MFS transporter [Erwinia sp. OLMDLW33]KYP83278.1 MFS transporter [bacteria symbiont BFo1 of Frankliniella occidentalis]KYP88292.1 MFS transporter [bacteria symbiont BFo1 of Frankliniella occidentalis]MCP2231642.1 putative MFS family arabinose efflux permease [Erwinia aphidicola]